VLGWPPEAPCRVGAWGRGGVFVPLVADRRSPCLPEALLGIVAAETLVRVAICLAAPLAPKHGFVLLSGSAQRESAPAFRMSLPASWVRSPVSSSRPREAGSPTSPLSGSVKITEALDLAPGPWGGPASACLLFAASRTAVRSVASVILDMCRSSLPWETGRQALSLDRRVSLSV